MPHVATNISTVVGQMGQAVVAAALAGTPIHLLSDSGRTNAADFTLLSMLAAETESPIYQYPLDDIDSALAAVL